MKSIIFFYSLDFDDVIHSEDDQKSLIYPDEYIDLSLSITSDLLEINIWSNIDRNKSK